MKVTEKDLRETMKVMYENAIEMKRVMLQRKDSENAMYFEGKCVALAAVMELLEDEEPHELHLIKGGKNNV